MGSGGGLTALGIKKLVQTARRRSVISSGATNTQIKNENGKDREVPLSRSLVQLYFDGMQRKVILRQHGKGTTYVNPVIFLKSFLDFMLKDRELRLKKRASLEKRKGTGRGIQVVLLNGAGQPAQR